MTSYYSLLKVLTTVLIVGLVISGCKKDNPVEPVDPPSIVSFTANPSSFAAGGGTATLSWKVTGATGLSVSPNVGAVTPTDNGSKDVIVSATTTFVLTATNAGGNVSANAQVTVAPPITLNGFVKDYDGEPISGVTVLVKGQSPSITNASGGFTISNVIAPYDITVILSTQKAATVYRGLTRSDPTLLYFSSLTVQKTATISGSVPVATGKTTKVFFVSGTNSWSGIASPTTGLFSFSPLWKGSTTSYSGKLYTLRWSSNANGLPSQYDAYGSKDLTMSAGGTFSGLNFSTTDLTDPPEQTISGTIVRPTSSYKLTEKYIGLNYGNAFVSLGGEKGATITDDFSYSVPNISGATFEVEGYCELTATPTNRKSRYWKMGIVGGTTGVSISLADAPQLNIPVHNATAVDTTTQLLWAMGVQTGVFEIDITPMTSGGGPTFVVFTAANSASIPNLSPQGLGLPSNVSYSWQVFVHYPLSMDNCASETLVRFVNGGTGSVGMGTSEIFSFTTK